MWSWSEAGECWVSTPTRWIPEWQQLLRVKSITRYLPPNGIALTARSAARTLSRLPLPPASTSANTSRTEFSNRMESSRGRPEKRWKTRSYGARGALVKAAGAASGHQESEADTMWVVSRFVSLGKSLSSLAKKRLSWEA